MESQKELIVMTGCSGRIGMRVAQRLGQKYQIVGFDIVPPVHPVANMEFVKVDLSSDESVKQGFEVVKRKYGDRIASIIHLAAYYSFSGARPELYDAITVNGTRRILENMAHFHSEQFIFSSTQLIYAPCETNERINENSPIIPKWDYPRSKVKAEKVIHDLRGATPTVLLRIAGCYDDACYCIPIANQIQRIYEKQFASHVFPGDLSHGAPFLHFDDLVECIALAVEKRKQLPNEVALLIGEDKTVSYDQMQREISDLLFGKAFMTVRVPKWFAKLGAWAQNHTPFIEPTFVKPWMIDLADDNYILDVSYAYQILSWKPRHFVKDSLPNMIQALKANPQDWYRKNGLTPSKQLKRKWSE